MSEPELKTMVRDFRPLIAKKRNELAQLSAHKIINRSKIQSTRIQLQALEEGQRDILTPGVTEAYATNKLVNQNNFATYSAQVQGAYEMYNNTCKYGGEIFHAIVKMKSAIIGGAGITIIPIGQRKKQRGEWIEEFLNDNKLHGSKLLQMITTGSLEGKNLIILNVKGGVKSKIKVASFSWYKNKYNIEAESIDSEDIKSVRYHPKKELTEEIKILPDRFVYVKIGGTEIDIDVATNGLHCSLTACENFSRAYYDLRTNSHYFSRLIPVWEFDANDPSAEADAQGIKAALAASEWSIDRGYAGRAKFRLAGPELTAHETLIQDMLSSLKIIGTNTGLPIHWLSWPELMSNRATAENLLEAVNYATIEERTIWEEGIKETIQKAMVMSINNGIADPGILGDFEVKIPLISLANLKQLIEVYWPLVLERMMSEATFRNMLPGINPEVEKKLIESEEKERAEKSPMNNKTVNDNLENMQNQEENDEDAE